MAGTITVSNASFARMFGQILSMYPNPEEPERHWPPKVGPVIRGPGPQSWQLGSLPTPWWLGYEPDPLRLGSHPNPWLLAALGRAIVDHEVGQYELAAILGSGQAEHASESISKRVMQIAIDICGNEVRGIKLPGRIRWPEPVPPRPEERRLFPVEKLAIGVQFLVAAELLPDSPLQLHMAKAGEMIVENGIQGLEQRES